MSVVSMAAAIACGGGGDGPAGPGVPTVQHVIVTPGSASLIVGQTTNLTATSTDAAGSPMAGQTVAWSTSDPTVATVSGGTVTALKAGGATIAATVGTVQGTAAITVLPVPVASVVVSPTPDTLYVTRSLQLTATLRDASGATLTDRSVTWSAADPLVASVSNTGLVLARGAGATTITATSEGKSGAATIVVKLVPVASVVITPTTGSLFVGRTFDLTATAKDSVGGTLTGRTVTWSSSDVTIATVSSTGRVTGQKPGTVPITVTCEGRSATVQLTVVPETVGSVSLTPTSATVAANQQIAFVATTKDTAGTIITGHLVTFTSSDPTVVAITAAGLAKALKPGTATITATSETRSAVATVTVTSESLGYGAPTERIPIVDVGDVSSPTVTYRDPAGAPAPATALKFTSRSRTIASVDASGRITALAPGQTWVMATSTSGNVTDSVYVIVPRSRDMPVVRTDLTEYLYRGGDTIVANVVVDPRTGSVGGATVGIGVPTALGALTNVLAAGSSASVTWTWTSYGLRATIASATGFTTPVQLVKIKLVTRVQSGFAGWLDVTVIDASAPDGTSLTDRTTSTRYPIILR
jgi:uncharacterized protein YjdB